MQLVDLERSRLIAYLCMEVGLGDPHLPTYSGGLGVLAGDTLRSAADLGVPMVGVTLLHREGYFRQKLDDRGRQSEEPERWEPRSSLEPMSPQVTLRIDGRDVKVRAWRLLLEGRESGLLPIYYLDAALAGNAPEDQALTGRLYGGDPSYRLRQQALLGLGGVAILEALGHDRITTYHMNEGHSALSTLALLERRLGDRPVEEATEADLEAVRQQCVFTTHTPVPAAMDAYPQPLVERVLGSPRARALAKHGCCHNGALNMTLTALRFARYVNGVAMRHGEVSRDLFPYYPVNSITNGVHAGHWAGEPQAALYDRHLPQWRDDPLYLRYAIGIPRDEVRRAHLESKRRLLAEVGQRTGRWLDEEVLTIGCARRATAYKRIDLIFSDLQRLRGIARRWGGLRILLAGKAHPADEGGKAAIGDIFEAAAQLEGDVEVFYLANYDMPLARQLVCGSDLWLNTPLRPNEASGTSGMKAALNGVPSLSVLDGWWIEGHVEDVTGWAIEADEPDRDAEALYRKLEERIAPLFHERPLDYAAVRRSAIALNGSFFNTQRMVSQYVMHAYRSSLQTARSDEPLPQTLRISRTEGRNRHETGRDGVLPDTRSASGTPPLDPQEVARRAYLIWEAQGRPPGKERAHWLEAERHLQRELRQA